MTFIPGFRLNDASDGHALATAAGTVFNPVVDRCITRVTPKGNVLGGVIYTNYTGVGGSIWMHVAAFQRNWVSRDGLWLAFDYPFNQLQVKKIFGQVPAWNGKALVFDLMLGFREEAVIKDVYPDGDMIVLAMYRADCRFLNIVPRTVCKGPPHG